MKRSQTRLHLLAAAVATATVMLPTGGQSQAATLDIALSNDDGWQAQGIQVLREALVAAGHRVTLASPAGEQSGSSAAINTAALRVRREAEDQFSVSACRDAACSELEPAEPATSAMVAIDISSRRTGHAPALLISGINSSNNLGAAAEFSGTVGAAIAAITRSVHGQVPAIAISTDVPASCKGDATCGRAHYAEVAAFISRLVDELTSRAGPGKPLLRPGLALNVNYPPAEPKGVRLAVQGRAFVHGGHAVAMALACEACLGAAVGESVAAAIGGARADSQPDVPRADTTSYIDGYVTIVPIEADLTARDASKQRSLGRSGSAALYPRAPGK